MKQIASKARTVAKVWVALVLTLFAQAAFAETKAPAPTHREVSYVDASRGVKASMGFAGSDKRRLDVQVWHPAKGKGPWPLVIYSHGTFGYAGNAMHVVNALVDAGYIVAAPDYPMSSRNAYTKIRFADVSDVSEQVKDVKFIIDQLMADPQLGKLIDKDRIGTTGHSLGAVTSYFLSFGATTRDPRIKATAPIAGGDPVQAALDTQMGMTGAGFSKASVPVLFLTAERDVFADLTTRPYVAYTRVAPPKYELIVKGGVHVWFRDGNEQPEGNKNPDCLFFEKNVPDMPVPMCKERAELIDPAKQQAITRDALVSFFDAYLKQKPGALERLKTIGERYPEAELVSQP